MDGVKRFACGSHEGINQTRLRFQMERKPSTNDIDIIRTSCKLNITVYMLHEIVNML